MGYRALHRPPAPPLHHGAGRQVADDATAYVAAFVARGMPAGPGEPRKLIRLANDCQAQFILCTPSYIIQSILVCMAITATGPPSAYRVAVAKTDSGFCPANSILLIAFPLLIGRIA